MFLDHCGIFSKGNFSVAFFFVFFLATTYIFLSFLCYYYNYRSIVFTVFFIIFLIWLMHVE